MVRLFLMRMLTIALILVLLATSLFFLNQYRTIKEEMEAEEAAMASSEIMRYENGIHAEESTSSPDSLSSENETPTEQSAEPIPVVNPGYRHMGNRMLTHDMGKIFVIDLKSSSVQQVYNVELPWYLIDYDLASDGMVALIVEKSKGSKAVGDYENQTRLILINPTSPDKPHVLEYTSDYGSDFYQMQTLAFSPNGNYLLVDDCGWDWDRYKIYRVQHAPNSLQMLKEVNGEGFRHTNAIGFDQASSVMYFRCEGERTTVYEYNLVRQHWRNILSDKVIPCYEWITDGKVFSVIKSPDNPKELQIVKLSNGS